ncbi:hypothetical protein HK096_011036, partial [Nowakowskiella sp. JEL0078]
KQLDLNGPCDCSNLVATIGKNQLNIYDNSHCGNHFTVLSHFVLDGDGYNSGI